MASRRRAREFTLQLLYQVDLRGATPDEVLSNFWAGADAEPAERQFAEKEVRGVCQHQQELDSLIEGRSINWKLSRMSFIDRNILRLGAYELLYAQDIPRSVVINECIELGKKYSTAESGGFINGILDKISQGEEGAAPPRPSPRKR